MTDQIAFIGVGNMGNPMADQLVKAGKKVKVYDVSPARGQDQMCELSSV